MSLLVGDLINRDNVSDTESLNLDGALGIEIVTIGSSTFLYVTGQDDNGITGFEVLPDGSLETITGAVVNDSAAIPLVGAFPLVSTTINESTFLYVGTASDGLTSFSVGADGSLTFLENVPDAPTIPDPGILEINDIDGRLAVATVDETQFLIASGFGDDGVSVFEIEEDGELDNTDNLSDNGALALRGAFDVVAVDVEDNTFAVVAGFIDSGVSVFEVDSDGTLTNTDTVFDGGDRELNGALGLATATIDGTAFVFASGFNDDGISVFALDEFGQLTNVFNLSDSSSLSLNGAFGLTAFTAGREHFLAVSAQTDGALSIFSIASDGSLELVDTVSDADLGQLELGGTSSNTFADVAGNPFVFATGVVDNGVSSFEFGGEDDLLTGTTEGDTILGFGGEDTLIGANGADRFEAGSGDDEVNGGSGDDTVRAGDGDDDVEGGDGDDELNGGDGDDTIDGGADDDTLNGRDGDDSLVGGEDDDLLKGQNGDDTLEGDSGDDRLRGGVGDDSLEGGSGFDDLRGAADNDTIRGGSERDQIRGNSGDDELFGEDGNDKIFGGTDDDTISGGTGNDRIKTGLGNDTVVYSNGDGRDSVSDLSSSDTLDLSDFGFESFSEVEDLSREKGNDVVINFGDGDTLLLRGLDLSDLDDIASL